MREHILKTWPNAWQAVRDGKKMFEWRKDDRGFEVGDVLVLRQWDPGPSWSSSLGGPLGFVFEESSATSLGARSRYADIRVVVTYILRGLFGIPDGYCIMGIEREGLESEREKLRGTFDEALAKILRETTAHLRLRLAQLKDVTAAIERWGRMDDEALVASLSMTQREYMKSLAEGLGATIDTAWKGLAPEDMVLHCPNCGKQHLDIGEFQTRVHRTHLCENTTYGPNTGCGYEWKPWEFPTRGVEKL